MMVDDHQGALDELKTMADDEHITLSERLKEKHEKLKQRLNGLSGYSFDTL